MIVEEVMNKKLKTLTRENTIAEAIELMKSNKIRHIPIVDSNNRLIGILSDRDVRDASPSILIDKDKSQYNIRVDSIMTTNIITGTPLDFVEDVAAIFYEFKISCLPILSGDQLVGIITESDLLRTFMKITGSAEPSSHIELRLSHRPGSLSEIIQIFQKRNLNITNVLLYPGNDPDYKRLVLRTQVMNTDDVVDELQKEGFEVLWPKKI